MMNTKNISDVGKKVGAVVGAALVAGSVGISLNEHSKASDLANQLAELQQLSLEQQKALEDMYGQLSSGVLVKADSIDITQDNEAAILKAIEGIEGLEYKDGKVVLVGPADNEEAVTEKWFTGKDLALGDSAKITIRSYDMDKLFDGKLEFGDEKVKAKEVIELSNDAKVAFSGSSEFSDTFAGSPFLALMKRESIKYGVKFTNPDWSKISMDSMLEMPFLGKKLFIAEHLGDSLLILRGKEMLLSGLETVEVNGKMLKILSIGPDSVSVEVDGTSKILHVGTVSKVNGLKILVKESLPRNELKDSMVSLVAGEEAYDVVKDGEGFDNEDDPEWVWSISNDFIGIKHNKKLDDAKEALQSGSELSLPEGFAKLKLECDNPDMSELTASFDEVEINDVDTKVLLAKVTGDELEANIDDDIVRIGSVLFDGSKFYAKVDNKYVEVSEPRLAESGLELSSDIVIDGIDIDVDLANNKFTGLSYNGMDLSNKKHDTLTQRGSIVSAVDDLDDAEELNLKLPSEQLMCRVKAA